MTMRNRVWPLCLAAFLFLAAVQAAFFPLGAAAETAPVAEATLLPADAESASPYLSLIHIFPGSLPQEHQALQHHDDQAVRPFGSCSIRENQ